MKRHALLAGVLAALASPKAADAKAAANLQTLNLATGWIGARPTISSLRGRVVLVDIFTFECINCTNITPSLKHLYAVYPRSDLEIIAVHTPEVASYQKSLSYLTRHTQAATLPWPIAIDNDERIWDVYGASAWPTQLIFDRSGHLKATIVGDSQDREVAATVRSLIHTG